MCSTQCVLCSKQAHGLSVTTIHSLWPNCTVQCALLCLSYGVQDFAVQFLTSGIIKWSWLVLQASDWLALPCVCDTVFTLCNWYAMICLTCFKCVWLTSYHVSPWFFLCVLCVCTHASDLSLHICNWFAMLCLTCFRCVRLVNVLRCVRLTSYDVCVTPSLHYVCVTPCPTFRYPE